MDVFYLIYLYYYVISDRKVLDLVGLKMNLKYVSWYTGCLSVLDFLIFETWYFEIEKKLSDTRYFKNQVEIDKGKAKLRQAKLKLK